MAIIGTPWHKAGAKHRIMLFNMQPRPFSLNIVSGTPTTELVYSTCNRKVITLALKVSALLSTPVWVASGIKIHLFFPFFTVALGLSNTQSWSLGEEPRWHVNVAVSLKLSLHFNYVAPSERPQRLSRCLDVPKCQTTSYEESGICRSASWRWGQTMIPFFSFLPRVPAKGRLIIFFTWTGTI